MSTYRLEHLLYPRSVAVIGASAREDSLGAIVLRQLISGGYKGAIIPVNPKYRTVAGFACIPDLEHCKEPPDLAVIVAPPLAVASIINDAGKVGVKTAVVLTAGLGHGQGSIAQTIALSARRTGLRIVGPNCLGVLSPHAALNASFAAAMPSAGDMALISQSGAVVAAMIAWAQGRHAGFSGIVSVGDMVDVDIGDCLDYFAADTKTGVILLYVEAIRDARKFLSAARAAARAKPVFVIKSGRAGDGAKAAATHTGALAGSDAVYGAAFRRSGLVRVDDLDELFAAAAVSSGLPRLGSGRLAILGNGGGVGVLAVDELARLGGTLAALADDTLTVLDAAMPATWSRANPVDIIGDAPPERYRAATEALLADPGVDALVVTNCPTAVASSAQAAQAVMGALRTAKRRKPVVAAWLDRDPATALRFEESDVPCFQTGVEAVRGFVHAVRHSDGQRRLMARPSAAESRSPQMLTNYRMVLNQALESGVSWLDPLAVAGLLDVAGIKRLPIALAATPQEAASAAAGLLETCGACALKIQSRDIVHKSDVGGVVLNLRTPAAIGDAAQAMLQRIAQFKPDAMIDGFVVQGMLEDAQGPELIAGATTDPVFGPILLFGAGGTAVEVLDDKAIGFPPLRRDLALDLIGCTRVSRLLKGYRDVPAANLDLLADVLVRLSDMLAFCPEVVSVDLNPLRFTAGSVIAVDARVALAAPLPEHRDRPERRLAIRPYPSHVSGAFQTPHGRSYVYRAIRAEDEDALAAFLQRISPEDIRLRFLQSSPRFDHAFLARLTQLDYDRAMALLAFEAGSSEVAGVVRAHGDANHERAEFAILVRSDLKGQGLGTELLRLIMGYAQEDGYKELYGCILAQNRRMIELSRDLGFEIIPDADISEQVIARRRFD